MRGGVRWILEGENRGVGQFPADGPTSGDLRATRREFQPQRSFPVPLHLLRPECDQGV